MEIFSRMDDLVEIRSLVGNSFPDKESDIILKEKTKLLDIIDEKIYKLKIELDEYEILLEEQMSAYQSSNRLGDGFEP